MNLPESRTLAPFGELIAHTLSNAAGIQALFYGDGTLALLKQNETMINRIMLPPGEPALGRIFLGTWPASGGGWREEIITRGEFEASTQAARWSSTHTGLAVAAELHLPPSESAWYWRVALRNISKSSVTFRLTYGQDLGLADEGAVRNNESYVSHYLDHTVVNDVAFGNVVLTRQNLPMAGGRFPWLAQGCRQGAAHFSTDGSQFFGFLGDLPSIRVQREFAYTGLQTMTRTLGPGETTEYLFFAVLQADHRKVSTPADVESLRTQVLNFAPEFGETIFRASPTPHIFEEPEIEGRQPSEAKLALWYPGERRVEETVGADVHSFFCGAHSHVVTRAKEIAMERPHGHILRSGRECWLSPKQVGVTVYARGIFGAQFFGGNTNLCKLTTVARGPVQLLRTTGERIFMETPEGWRRLGVPSVFEMAINYARWIYQFPESRVEIMVWCGRDEEAAYLRIRVEKGERRRFIIAHQIVAGENEMGQPCELRLDADGLRIIPGPNSLPTQHMPGQQFMLHPLEIGLCEALGGGELLGLAPNTPYAAIRTAPALDFSLAMGVTWTQADHVLTMATWDAAMFRYPRHEAEEVQREWTGGVAAKLPAAYQSLAEIMPWFAHNAMTHFTAPHGLEQYGGAAWGTRDVCQGALEWLLATGRHAVARRVITTVFAQQYRVDPMWPQWFMHPPFQWIQDNHCHGDIPFWPVKALCDYIEASNDFAVLDEAVPYTNPQGFAVDGPAEPILDHVRLVIGHFRRRCIAGTALVNYGDGDWDDTLQPADPTLRSHMVSAWTVALSFHAFSQLREICTRAGKTELAAELAANLAEIDRDFHTLLMPDGIVAGFSIWDGAAFTPMLHPRDNVIGIHYRLLPMTRSILASLFTPEEAERHLGIIRDHMLFPDGARLMSSPVPYTGGIMRHFKRAEAATYFGREVSLQYVHAHIRYAEALGRSGDAAGLLTALQLVNPAGLGKRLANAAPRQSNAYFSSSDGDFTDRVEAFNNYQLLRTGEVRVKGGWRVYSSGPGMVVHKIVTELFGLRSSFGDLWIDPMLTPDLNGAVLNTHFAGRTMEATFHIGAKGSGVTRVLVDGKEITTTPRTTRYRNAGVLVAGAAFTGAGAIALEVFTE